jgi:kumamolisin
VSTPSPERPVPGSDRGPLPGAHRVGDARPQAPVEVTLVLRRAEDRAGAGADHDDIEKIERFAHDHGLTVTFVRPEARSVGLAGTVEQMDEAFGVRLGEYRRDDLVYRGREGTVKVPGNLSDVVVGVLGLDDRPQARAHFRYAGGGRSGGAMEARVPVSGYAPQEVAKRYDFPTGVDGTGQTIAVIELGGGYRTADLRQYFKDQGIRMPSVTAVSVDGAKNSPGDDADGEVMLDIEVIGAVAPGARIAVYFAPNTSRGFYDAIAAALHDTRRKPSVVSISWGQNEAGWTAQAMDSYDALFADAAALGVTVYAAAGDDGSADNADGLNVDFPASSPHVIACGGTTLSDGDEVVWNETASGHGATGGGVSVHFGLPEYQNAAKVPKNPDGKPGRGVPDVSGNADPLTGYRVRVDGRNLVIGGTSAVAPLWSGLTALANQSNKRPAGDPHERLYAHLEVFVDITSGDNGGYRAGPGWDACTGLGSPKGVEVAAVLGR